MQLSLFDYKLPKELIAQEPANPRSSSRLMVLKGDSVEHKMFSDITKYISKGDVIVVNETKVGPVKLVGKKSTGSPAELIISKKLSPQEYECQITTNKPKLGTELLFNKGLKAKILDNKDGIFKVLFNTKDVESLLPIIGEMPLPPYIKNKADKETYQTVYAKNSGSIAAPTAGFHFTPEIMQSIEKKGAIFVKLTLHVSFGTFLPVKTDNIEEHKMHEEWFEISEDAAKAINNRKGKLIVVGTTSLRALESSCDADGKVNPRSGTTGLFVYPGYKFRIKPDMMVTNFHLPKSTLLMLVCALAGMDKIMSAYRSAVENKYRFYSFGDAMLLSLTE